MNYNQLSPYKAYNQGPLIIPGNRPSSNQPIQLPYSNNHDNIPLNTSAATANFGQGIYSIHGENIIDGGQNKRIFTNPGVQPSILQGPRIEEINADDPSTMVQKSVRMHLETLKNELLTNFNNLLRDMKNEGRSQTSKELHEIKSQIIDHNQKFEYIQQDIQGLSKKFSDIDSSCVKELDNIKQICGLSNQDNPSYTSISANSTLNHNDLKRLEGQFNQLKQVLIDEINFLSKQQIDNGIKQPIKILGPVNNLREIKTSFENGLKNDFNSMNSRVKMIEDNLSELWKKKVSYMESIKIDMNANLTNQEKALQQEIFSVKKNLELKPDENTIRNIVMTEVPKKISIKNNQILQDIENNQFLVIRKEDEIISHKHNTMVRLEYLDKQIRDQLQDLAQSIHFRSTVTAESDKTKYVEQELGKINVEIDQYKRNYALLQSQIEEVRIIAQQFKEEFTSMNTNSVNKYTDIFQNLELQLNTLKQEVLTLEKKNDKSNDTSANIISSPGVSNTNTTTSMTSQLSQNSNTYTPISTVYQPSQPIYQPSYIYNSHSNSYLSPTVNITSSTSTNVIQPSHIVSDSHKSENLKSTAGYSTNHFQYKSNPTAHELNEHIIQYSSFSGNILEKNPQNTSNTTQLTNNINFSIHDDTSYENPQYYANPKVKAIIDEINYGKKSHEPEQSSLQTKSAINYGSPIMINNYELQGKNIQLPGSQFYGTTAIPNKSDEDELKKANSINSQQNQNSHISSYIPQQIPQFNITNFNDFESFKDDNLPNMKDQGHNAFLSPNSGLANNIKSLSEGSPINNPYEIQGNNSQQPKSKIINSKDEEQFVDIIEHKDEDIFAKAKNDNLNSSNNNNGSNQFKNNLEITQGTTHNEPTSNEKLTEKQIIHKKILAQIEYFINGTISDLLSEDDEIFCNLDDDGYIFDEDGDFVLDNNGNRIKLTQDQIDKFKNNDMIE